jgi:hypothetical protein
MSRHQRNIDTMTEEKPKRVVARPKEYPWKYITLPVVSVKAESEETKGIALGSTKWKAWRWVYKEKNFILLYYTNFLSDNLASCMPELMSTDCTDCDPKMSSVKYVICDVKYDRSGELIRNANGDPTQFCNKHDSQISAMFDRAMSSVEKQQHQSTMRSPSIIKN